MPSDNVMRAAKRVARCKPVDWDCSRSPGHPGLDALLEAVDALRAALAAPVSPPAASRDALAEVLAPLVAKSRRPVPKMDGSHNPNPADIAIAREMADAILSRWSAPPALHATDLAAMAKGIDEECCCVACGREVAPSPCCPDYPVWPGPCRSCYAVDAAPPAPRGEAVAFTETDAADLMRALVTAGRNGRQLAPVVNDAMRALVPQRGAR